MEGRKRGGDLERTNAVVSVTLFTWMYQFHFVIWKFAKIFCSKSWADLAVFIIWGRI